MSASPFRRLAAARWPWIVLLLALAGTYYGSYVRYGIGFRDEGQTVALCAQRLLAGERPFTDVVLNYNVLWFYPVVGLYELFGVSYVLLRGWCFALSTVTAVLGFFIVEKAGRRPWLAFLVGALLVLLPGSTFKNYIPLLAVSNTLCLLHYVLASRPPRAPLLAGALTLGLSFLIRIDVALFFTALWLGVLILRAVLGPERPGQRAAALVGGMMALTGGVLAPHVPVYLDAQHRGFDVPFLHQYAEKWRMISQPFTRLGKRKPGPVIAPISAPQTSPESAPAVSAPAVKADKKMLQRASIGDLNKDGQNAGAAFLFLMFAPILVTAVCLTSALIGMVRARDWEERQRPLAVLALIGGALTVFPQFFFFRPDVPHLSEFMPGFLAASVAGAALLWASSPRWLRLGLAVFLAVHTAVYVWRVLPDRWAGTSAIRKKRTQFFAAENGVNVYVSSRELKGLTAIQRLIREHSQPTDYVVCYPYSPGINLLTNRRTYEKNVYVDNAMRTTNWDTEAIARFEKFRPAVIVLSDWDINGSESSRFSVWAVKTKTWVQTHYIFQGAYIAGSDTFEIYTRPTGGG